MIKTGKHIDRKISRMNRKDQEIKQQSDAYLDFDKGGRNIYWKKDSLFNKWCWKTGYLPAEESN